MLVSAVMAYIGQNIEELSGFSHKMLLAEFLKLLQNYNQRVDAVESDKSMMIEIPANLMT